MGKPQRTLWLWRRLRPERRRCAGTPRLRSVVRRAEVDDQSLPVHRPAPIHHDSQRRVKRRMGPQRLKRRKKRQPTHCGLHRSSANTGSFHDSSPIVNSAKHSDLHTRPRANPRRYRRQRRTGQMQRKAAEIGCPRERSS